MKNTLKIGIMGFLLGYVLSRAGFTDFNQVHNMLVFREFRLLLTFMGAVMVLMAGYFLLPGRQHLLKIPFRKKAIISGGVLFGIGWALTGACPAAAIVQIGEGKLPAFLTFAGILLGIKLATFIKKSYSEWHNIQDCSE